MLSPVNHPDHSLQKSALMKGETKTKGSVDPLGNKYNRHVMVLNWVLLFDDIIVLCQA